MRYCLQILAVVYSLQQVTEMICDHDSVSQNYDKGIMIKSHCFSCYDRGTIDDLRHKRTKLPPSDLEPVARFKKENEGHGSFSYSPEVGFSHQDDDSQ